jgi:hypothetical protein
MNKLLIITAVFLMAPLINTFCQDSKVLSQFSEFDIKTGKQVIDEDITMKVLEDEDLGLMPEDSLNYKYIDKVYQKRLVRLELATVQKTFPEVISVTPEGDSILDYISLIPLLMEAVHEQQILIKELESLFLSSIEKSK